MGKKSIFLDKISKNWKFLSKNQLRAKKKSIFRPIFTYFSPNFLAEGDCGFLAANLCAHSIFGEDALANVSVEKALPMDDSSPIVGHIRIRAKSQGMCLTLGDKLSSAMRSRRDGQPIAAPSA